MRRGALKVTVKVCSVCCQSKKEYLVYRYYRWHKTSFLQCLLHNSGFSFCYSVQLAWACCRYFLNCTWNLYVGAAKIDFPLQRKKQVKPSSNRHKGLSYRSKGHMNVKQSNLQVSPFHCCLFFVLCISSVSVERNTLFTLYRWSLGVQYRRCKSFKHNLRSKSVTLSIRTYSIFLPVSI